MREAHQQRPFAIRVEWGLDGAMAIAAGADVAVVVDVLSFTTTVSVALDAGMTVLPYRWADEGAAGYAARQQAVLAVGRAAARPGQVSLSPATVRAATGITRLVLPSPNGSTIAADLAEAGSDVLAGCLRNAGAVARWVTRRHGADGATVAVVAAGERWPSGALRAAVEDQWGAGAVVSALLRAGWSGVSPEAATAAAAFDGVRADLGPLLRSCASGVELTGTGFGGDVEIAAELGSSQAVPRLSESGFRAAGPL